MTGRPSREQHVRAPLGDAGVVAAEDDDRVRGREGVLDMVVVPDEAGVGVDGHGLIIGQRAHARQDTGPATPPRAVSSAAMTSRRAVARAKEMPSRSKAVVTRAIVGGLLPLAQGLLFKEAFQDAGPDKAPDFAGMMVGFGAFGVAMLVFMIVYGLGYGAMFVAATDALSGREISMRRAWALMVRPRVLGTLVLIGLAVTVGLAFCILPGLYLGLIYAFTIPVIAAESRFGTAAMSRSSELARYNPQGQFDSDPRLHVFITVLVGTMLGYMINLLFELPVMAFQQFVMMREVAAGQKPDPGEMMARLTWIQVPSSILSMLTNAAVQLYVAFGIALLFFDVKRRKEGGDLEAAVAGLVERRRARRQP